ncbi:MAG: Rrf2 family transcriptional regulator [Hyphomicrobiaceae bacterium]
MKLNKQTTYAVKLLVDCARANGDLVKAASAAKRSGLTQSHALKIAHALMRSGFLINQRGRNGGIRLSRPASEIRIGDVVRAMEATGAGESGAEMDGVLDDAFAAFIGVLDQYTIQDFAKQAAAAEKRKTRRAPAGRPKRRTSAASGATLRKGPAAT